MKIEQEDDIAVIEDDVFDVLHKIKNMTASKNTSLAYYKLFFLYLELHRCHPLKQNFDLKPIMLIFNSSKLRGILIICVTFFTSGIVYAQNNPYLLAPKITYATSQNYLVNNPIQPLSPRNTGGAVPANVYGQVTVIAGNVPSAAQVDGVGIKASFYYPSYLSIDSAGNVYISDSDLLRRLDPSGVVTTLGIDGVFKSTPPASLAFQTGNFTMDNSGNMYISLPDASSIKRINTNHVIESFAGNPAYNGNSIETDGVGANAYFVGITGMVTDKFDNLYTSDAQHTIRKITPQGVVTTLAGDYRIQGISDGVGAAARFGNPENICIDTAGNLFVNDNTAQNIRKITPQGIVSTIKQYTSYPYFAGLAVDNTDNIYLGINSPSTTKPSIILKLRTSGVDTITDKLSLLLGGMVIDKQGNLIVAESNTALIKRVNVTGYTINPNLPTGLIFDSKTGIISGTPAATSPNKDYTITAYNASGSSSFKIAIVVQSNTTTISSISPTTAVSGSTVIVKGYKFTGATALNFGGVPAKSFTVNSDTVITAIVDTGLSGTVSLTTPLAVTTFPGFVFVPVPTVVANGPLTFLAGETVVLNVNPSTGYIYQWNKDNKPIAGATATSYTVSSSGAYSVTITINSVSQTSTQEVVKSIFKLPATNFSLSATSVSCKGMADGTINISANQNLNYYALITGNGINASFPFTTTLAFNALTAGIYHVCITVTGQPDYQQCYDMIVVEPKDLSVYALVDATKDSITLTLSGADKYNIYVNNNNYTTADNKITIPLEIGNNNIKVATDRLCQGVFEKLINISGRIDPYPNPFVNTLNLNIGNSIVHKITVEIYKISAARQVYSKRCINQSGVLQLDLSRLDDGVYVLQLSLDDFKHIYKIFKK